MAGSSSVQEAGFWLPSEFLTDDDFLIDKENFNNTQSDSGFFFPTEFPYDFETESHRRLEKKFWVMSTSPQSTLAGHLGSWKWRSSGGSSNGSPSGLPSPPTTPLSAKYDAVGDLIYRAAGQVARLKLNGGDGLGPGSAKHKGLLGPPRSVSQFYTEAKNPNPSFFPNTHRQQNERCGMWYSQQQMYQNRDGRAVGGVGQAAWTLQQNPTCGRTILWGRSGGSGGGGSAAKRACAGTGVFLPRRYVNNNNDSNTYSSDSRKKPGGRATIDAPTKNLDDMNGFIQSQEQQYWGLLNRGFVPDHNIYSVMAGKHAIVLQQRHRSLLTALAEGNRDIYLPQEWTYY